MQVSAKILRLYELGHFFNPAYPNNLNVSKDDVLKLTWEDKVVQDAFLSFQYIMGMPLNLMGSTGPNDMKLFDVERCGVADFQNPALLGKVGSGSWPEPCQKAGITYSVDKGGMPSKYASTWEQQIELPVVAAWAKVGARMKKHTGSGQANIRIMFSPLFGSTIGIAQFNSQNCSGSVTCKLDTGFAPNEATEAELLCHETGHNMNLNHTRGGIMHPSLSSTDSFIGWTPSDPSWNTIVRYFGGEPVDLPIPIPGVEVLPDIINVNNVVGDHKLVIDFKKNELLVNFKSGKKKIYILLNNDII